METQGYSAAERLERLPISGYHRLIFIIIALAFFFDSMDLAMMTFLLGSIKAEFALSSAQAGLLASSSFFGMVLGASLSGMLADRFGRKPVFQWSIVLWGLASYLCSTAQTVEMLTLFRILLGIGMGMEFPIAQSMLSELIPAKRRGRYIALMDGFWPLGFVAAGVLSYFLLPLVGWRDIFLVLAIPAVFVLAIRFFIPESPRWLEQAGHHGAADKVLCGIEDRVRASLKRAALPMPVRLPRSVDRPPSFFSAFRQLWSPLYRQRTMMIWSVWFFALLGFYGLTSWLSALLQQSGFAVTQSVYYTVLISLGGIPGFLVAAWLVELWGRKPVCIVTLLGGGVMAFLYGQSAVFGGNVSLLIVSGLLMQFFLFGMWAVLYTYTPELYPTSARATGSGFASAIGRVGSLLGPLVTGLVFPVTGQGGVFALGALCFAIAAAVVWRFGMETRGKTLEELSEGVPG
ncbi:MFS transporter [Pseudomonas gingeri NCPPB 3146 = LMG 5327]|uniref:MFS transporter n=4 Tax=Pseudomonas gingeri TaxID=117681 RepID=A0A7Y8CG97_9PSED|nr:MULTISPECIES: MFS transporter [Pseudomonas]NVZ65070.1 MFS transporter [Pseudomonas gingeri]NVZ77936.1 MFS transporter [Pseudomonas gingeri]NWC18010.1 MFS transporter [Pseudomonas gingeri]NWE73419.1 MFS transporter [Pseudomonas gingeri]PNQ90761.1 MFS transporter [Pseudomonas gingeri NCPPB 3146 = LMG 5327]